MRSPDSRSYVVNHRVSGLSNLEKVPCKLRDEVAQVKDDKIKLERTMESEKERSG